MGSSILLAYKLEVLTMFSSAKESLALFAFVC